MATEATNEKVIVKDTVVNDNAWENLGALRIYDYDGHYVGIGYLLYKVVPGLGKRFSVLYSVARETGNLYSSAIFSPSSSRVKCPSVS